MINVLTAMTQTWRNVQPYYRLFYSVSDYQHYPVSGLLICSIEYYYFGFYEYYLNLCHRQQDVYALEYSAPTNLL